MMQRVELRCYGGQIVDAYVRKRGLLFSLVQWKVNSYWETPGDCGPPITKCAWRPNWRIL